MVLLWVILAALFGLAGYMEYYVQRHGKLAFFSYSVMEHCLVGILVIGITMWKLSQKKVETIYQKPHFLKHETVKSDVQTPEVPTDDLPELRSEDEDILDFDLQDFDLEKLGLQDVDLQETFDI